MDLGLHGKTAFITGGTRGIGLACALQLHVEGVRVAVVSRSAPNVTAARRKLEEQGPSGSYLALECDYSDGKALRAAMTSATEFFGQGIDILVGSSGGPKPGPAAEVDKSSLEGALDGCVHGLVDATRYALDHMRTASWGRIVYIGTSGVVQSIDNLALSNMARSALNSYAHTLSREVASYGITVNTVLPGKIETSRLQSITASRAQRAEISLDEQRAHDWEEIPVGRYGDPGELAALVTFLCSARAGYVTGSTLRVDGGYIRSR